jgi:tetratricopeptide (TPR) repeat protein
VRGRLGQHEEAAACYQRAAGLFADLGARWYLANVLVHLGEAREAAGDLELARGLWREALELYEELDPAAAEELAPRLANPQPG